MTSQDRSLKKQSDLVNDASNLESLVYNLLDHYFKAHQGILPPSGLYKRILTEVERPLFFLTLKFVNGNQKKAAQILGLNRNTLRKKVIEQMQQKNTLLTKISKKL